MARLYGKQNELKLNMQLRRKPDSFFQIEKPRVAAFLGIPRDLIGPVFTRNKLLCGILHPTRERKFIVMIL